MVVTKMTDLQIKQALILCYFTTENLDTIDDKTFGEAVTAAQTSGGIVVDGIAAAETVAMLSERVRNIQMNLNKTGNNCPIDGLPGPLTDQAVKAFQHQNGLIEDGIVGTLTESALNQTAISNALFNPDEQVTEHFNMREFQCECGGRYCNGFPVEVNRILIEKLEMVRQFLDIPLVISSGVRCEELNREVGGVWDSYHKLGRAADVLVYESNGYRVDDVADAGEKFGLKTIRYYDQRFVHFQYND
jgi:hypothetical protein